MVQTNDTSEQVVRRFFALLNAEDLEGIRSLLTEDAAWLPMAKDMPGAGEYLTISAIIKDPEYLRADYYVAPVFVRESDASKWQPAPCTLTAAR